jgi:hypothetical protein
MYYRYIILSILIHDTIIFILIISLIWTSLLILYHNLIQIYSMVTYSKSIIIVIKLIIYNFDIIIIYNTLKMLIQIIDTIFISVSNYPV